MCSVLIDTYVHVDMLKRWGLKKGVRINYTGLQNVEQICLNMNIQIYFACGLFTLRISNERNSSSGETICHVF